MPLWLGASQVLFSPSASFVWILASRAFQMPRRSHSRTVVLASVVHILPLFFEAIRLGSNLLPCTSMKILRIALSGSLALVAAPSLVGQRIETPTTVIDHSTTQRVVKLEFGLKAADPARWTGRAAVSTGTIHSAWGWHFNRPDRIVGTAGWDLYTRALNPEGTPYRLPTDLLGGVRILPNGIYLSVEAPASDRLSVTTNHGDFEFGLAELDARGRLETLAGDAAVVAVPAIRALTRGEATQHDYPAALATADGLFVAWTAFHNEANTLYLAHRRDLEWRTYRVTPSWGDYFGTALARDPKGRVHVIWSEYREDRWRLVDRAFDPSSASWGPDTYIAPGGSRQYFPVAATASDGTAWVAWQEFRGDDLDVMAASHDGSGWSAPTRVSESEANDWAPDLAAAPDGSVWVAWDSYDTGSYDILVRRLRPGGADRVIALPSDRNRAIEPSIAVDAGNRVWVTWAQSGFNWGKDWGVLGRPGTQVRATSEVRLARYSGGRWMEPVESLSEAVPAWMSDMHEYPEIAIGREGVPYVFFRKMMLRVPVAEHALQIQLGSDSRRLQPWYDTIRGLSEIRLAGFDGARWLPLGELPLSAGGAHAQMALARTDNRTVAVWPTDKRSYEDPHVRSSQIRYASLDLDARYTSEERLRPLITSDAGFVDAAPTEEADLARVRSARWTAKAPLRLFRGDLHRHTDLSADSQRDGDILFAYRYALDAGALDFLAVTDHSGAERLHFYKYQWWKNRQIATMFNQPGRFATFFGYERTVTFPGGHRNVISTRREMQPVPISDEEFTGNESWSERLYPSLLRHGDIAIAHTTAGGGGTDWRTNDPRAEPVVEVFQALRGSYEEENSPGKARSTQPAGFVWNAWKKGWRIGLLSNSDHESTHQSYACVWAPELTNEAILDAIKQRLTYAATDNVIVQFEARTGSGMPSKMGAEVEATEPPEFLLRAVTPRPVALVEVIRSGEVVYSAEPQTSEVEIAYRDSDAPYDGSAYYHVRLVQQDGQIAWSTPIWIEYRRSL